LSPIVAAAAVAAQAKAAPTLGEQFGQLRVPRCRHPPGITHVCRRPGVEYASDQCAQDGVGRRSHGRRRAHGRNDHPSRPDTRWDDLGDADFCAAQDAIDDLIADAADTSEWAIKLGAAGLEPEAHTLSLDGGGRPLVRIHCAFHPDMDKSIRVGFMTDLAKLIADNT
jgi:hypothetical protein